MPIRLRLLGLAAIPEQSHLPRDRIDQAALLRQKRPLGKLHSLFYVGDLNETAHFAVDGELGCLAMGAFPETWGSADPPVQDDPRARNFGELPGMWQQFRDSLQSIAQGDSGELRDPAYAVEARQFLHAFAQCPLCLPAGHRQSDCLRNALVEFHLPPVEPACPQALQQQLAYGPLLHRETYRRD